MSGESKGDEVVGKESNAGGSEGEARRRKDSPIALVMEASVEQAASETPPKEKSSRFSKRQWILLIFFSAIDLVSAMTISMQAPFYPQEAERKGATAAEYGAVFGIFEFVVFLSAPVLGKYMNKLGPKKVFSLSILINSISVILFGALDWVNDHTWFISLSLICRVFEGLGASGFFTSTFVIIACEFPQNVASTFATLETFIGFGLIAGPTVGGALYGLGGFPIPFWVVGTCLMAIGFLSIPFMPITSKAVSADGTEEKGYGVWTILKIPSVALAALTTASTAMSYGYVSATLEPHIRRFGLTPLETGLVFIVNGGVYAVTAPLWGLICDKIKQPAYITILGNFLICISFILIGPAIFVPVDTILWVTIIGLLIQGLGFGCCWVSTFIVGLKESMKNGLPDNLATYAVVAGLWQSMISLGAFVGPSLGGLLYDTVGFREGSWLILVVSFISGMAIVMYTCLSSNNSSSSIATKEESQPLLKERDISSPGGNVNFEESLAVGPSTLSPKSYGSTT